MMLFSVRCFNSSLKIQCFIYKSEFEDQLLNCTCHKEHEEHKEHKEHEEHEEQKEQRNIRNIRNKRNKRNIRKEHKEQKEHKNHKEMESVRDPYVDRPQIWEAPSQNLFHCRTLNTAKL